jgi:formylglycine-generating enzyme required for sulfatase activity
MGTADTAGLDRPIWAVRELQSEQPQHEVELTSGCWIDTYEVTNAVFQAFVDDGGYGPTRAGPGSRNRTANPPSRASTRFRTIPESVSPGTMPRPTPVGGVVACLPRPSGSTPRAAYRHFENPPTYQDHHIGFRIVTSAEDRREG